MGDGSTYRHDLPSNVDVNTELSRFLNGESELSRSDWIEVEDGAFVRASEIVAVRADDGQGVEPWAIRT